jgi:hypothetical protein
MILDRGGSRQEKISGLQMLSSDSAIVFSAIIVIQWELQVNMKVMGLRHRSIIGSKVREAGRWISEGFEDMAAS